MLTLSQKGVDFIVNFENKLKRLPDGRYKSYRCPAGKWTIFAGCTAGVDEDTVCTEAEGAEMFSHEIRRIIYDVSNMVRVPLSQNAADALISFAYNCGTGALRSSTLLRKLNAEDYDGAAEQFARWNKCNGEVLRGLTRRRAAERALFEAPDHEPDIPIPPLADRLMPQAVDAQEHREPWQSKTVMAQGLAGVGVVSGIVSSVKDTMHQVKQTAHDAADIGAVHLATHPSAIWIILGVLSLAAVAFTMRDRITRLMEGR